MVGTTKESLGCCFLGGAFDCCEVEYLLNEYVDEYEVDS